MSTVWTLVLIAACAAAGGALWLWLLNSPHGERYIKQRIQGPFIPLEKTKDE